MLPVSDSKVLLLFQRMNKGDEEVLVIEESGEHGNSLLYIWPGGAGWLREGERERRSKTVTNTVSRTKDLESHYSELGNRSFKKNKKRQTFINPKFLKHHSE